MDYLEDMNDFRLKPRLLRSMLRDLLPDDEKRPSPTPSQLSSALHLIKTHGLLSESFADPTDRKLADAWKSAVDEWVERVLKLVSSDMADKCWAGVSLLGITCEECSSDRFVASYSDWFHRLLSNIQPLSDSQFVKISSCASFSGLFARLSAFPNVKKDATSLAIKLVQPALQLLVEDATDNVLVEAVNLITTLVIYFSSSLHRHYDKIETVIVSKIMSARYGMGLSKRLACCLALLPKTRGDRDSWCLMMERVLIAINNDLNDAFQGLEEGQKSSEIIKLLIPPGKELPPPLGSATLKEVFHDPEKRIREFLVPRISILLQCCCSMLTNPYPVQVQVPIYPLLKVVERLLMMNGSKHDSLLSFTTSLHQGLLCCELPTLHLMALDLLVSIIKGLRSQLLPHAANIVQLLGKYFKSASVPIIRVKLYSIMKELLLSVGSGMAPYVGDLLLNNAFSDVDSYRCETPGVGSEVHGTSINYASKVGNGDIHTNTHKKRKHNDKSSNQNGTEIVPKAICGKPKAPLSVQIAAIEALRALLSVGGSLKSESWRSNLDLLLIGMIINADDAACEESFLPVDEATVTRRDLQLAAMQLLLASLLSATRLRPRYLSLGLQLFHRGKLETGTKLAEFCTRALLSLEVLIHPRVLSVSNVAEETPMDKFGDFNNNQPFGNIYHHRLESVPFSSGFLNETTPSKFGGFNGQPSEVIDHRKPDVIPFSSDANTSNNLTLNVSSEKDLVLKNHEEELRHDSQQGGSVSEVSVGNVTKGTSVVVVEKQPASILVTDLEHDNHMIIADLTACPDERAKTNNHDNDVMMTSEGNISHIEICENPSPAKIVGTGFPVINYSTRPTTEDDTSHTDALSSRIEILRKRLAAESQMDRRNLDYDSDETSLDAIPDIVDEEPESD